MAKIKAMICNVGEPACVVEIDNELETFQDIVDGYIETFYPFGDDI